MENSHQQPQESATQGPAISSLLSTVLKCKSGTENGQSDTSGDEEKQECSSAKAVLDQPGLVLAQLARQEQPHGAEHKPRQQQHHHAQAHADLCT